MSRIQNKFAELKSKKEKALIAYLMMGFPSEKDSLAAVRGLIKGGADIIELGFPFSDPIADGPIIQNASNISIKKGTKTGKYFSFIKKIRKETDIPLVLMTYTNILYHQGFDKFMKLAKKAGIDGLILPDMSIEESKEYLKYARKNKLDTIFLISPNTSKTRIQKISKGTTGFLYLVSVFGTTGAQSKIQKYSLDAIKKTKKIINGRIPVGIGFGISTSNDVKKYLSKGADAVIIGSAFLRLIEKEKPSKITPKMVSFTKKLKNATR